MLDDRDFPEAVSNGDAGGGVWSPMASVFCRGPWPLSTTVFKEPAPSVPRKLMVTRVDTEAVPLDVLDTWISHDKPLI